MRLHVKCRSISGTKCTINVRPIANVVPLNLLQERIVLQTVRWRMRVDIAVDPDMPLGSRASLVGRPYQEQPHILNYQEPIPPNALGRPNANDAQVLMWRPRRGAPLVVIPPK